MAKRRLDPSKLERGKHAHEIAAIVALIRSAVISPVHRLSGVLDHVGSAVELVQLSEQDRLFKEASPTHDLVGAVTAEDIGSALSDVEKWLDSDYDIRTVLDSTYPSNLHSIFDRPPLLFVKGTWDDQLHSRSVAVVGARKASVEGQKRARRLSRELIESGFTIISGLAVGIDTAAHTAALAAHSNTVAVMGTGIERIFPAENKQLAEQILATGGALLSQFFPKQPPTRWTFPMRNITMSGLTLATVVVEASETSGARMQARVALQHGRPVFLLSSLVSSHDWARTYVERGAYGTRAIEVSTTAEIVDRLLNPASREFDLQSVSNADSW